MIGIYFLICATLIILILRFTRALVSFVKRRSILRRIPCPPGHWLWGNLSRDLWNDTDKLFYILRDCARDYWPIYRLETLGVTAVNLLHPNDIEIVLSDMKHMRKSLIYHLLGKWLGKGLLTSTGQEWHTRRKILTPAFHFSILKNFLEVFNQETEKLVADIEKHCDEPCIDVVPLVTQMTLGSICETAMGMSKIDQPTQEKYKESIYKLGKLLITKLVVPLYTIPHLYQFTKLYKEEEEITNYLHEFAYQVISLREIELQKKTRSHENGSCAKRMLDLLLEAKMNGSDIDLKGIREEVDTFMFEGHDTTAVAITFLLLNLANYKNIQETVGQEIKDVIGSGVPTYENLQQLKYTERVIKESLRLFPSVPFISRVAGENFTTYTGYDIPKGTVLNIHIIDVHQNPEIYPDPLKFDPDRFLPENCQRHPYAYLPFSAGPRNCIGQRFAILELKAVLCGILKRFSLQRVDKPSDIIFSPDLVLRPKTAVRIKFVPK